MRRSTIRLALTIAAVSIALLSTAAVPAWAFRGLATITGEVQGVIKGDNITKDGAGAIVVRAMSFGLDRPVDPLSGLPIAKARFQPFRLVKDPDRATPPLLRAAVTNERLNVTIKWFRPIATGAEQQYFTVTLQNAKITSMDSEGDVTIAGGVVETIGFVYEKITMKDEVNGTIAEATP